MKRALLVAGVALFAAAVWPGESVLSHEPVTTTVTFDKEISRIVSRKCIACHSDKNLGVPLTSYEQTRPWARAIQEEVLRRHMPPWRAVSGYGEFVNDIGLTNRERQFIVSWVEGNGPKTRQERLISNLDQTGTEKADRLSLDFDKWQLGEPDLLRSLPAKSFAAGQTASVERVTIDLGLTAERWVDALEFKPSDRRSIRAAFFSLENGQWLGSWTPWYGFYHLPANTAYRLPAGSKVVAEIYYASVNEAFEEKSRLGLYYLGRRAAQSPADVVIEATQPGSDGRTHSLTGIAKLPAAAAVLALKPDLEASVQSIEVSARKPNGAYEVLLLVRDVLPEWPTPYILTAPVHLPAGTELRATYRFDRSSPPGLKLIVSTYAPPPMPPATNRG